MAESPKRTERVHCNLSEREALDLARMANASDRTVSDFVYVLIRRYLYGHCRPMEPESQQSRRASQALDFADSAFDPASR